MRIAQLLSSLDAGGAQRQVLALSGGLTASGHRVWVASIRRPGVMASAFASAGLAVSAAGRSETGWDALGPMASFLRRIRPDLIHCHMFKADLIGTALGLTFGIPVVATLRNQDQFLERPHWAAVGRGLLRLHDGTVAITQAVRDHWSQHTGADPSRIVVIPIALTVGAEHSPVRRAGGLRLGVIGRLEPQKDPETALRAFAVVRARGMDATLHFYGEGRLASRLRALAARLKVEDASVFHGFVEDPCAAYRDVDVVIMPSRWEGAGNVALECAAFGLPLVAARVGGIPEMAAPDGTLWVPPEDVNALANALVRLCADVDLRRRLSLGAAGHAERFSARGMVRAHEDFYARVLDRPGAGSRSR